MFSPLMGNGNMIGDMMLEQVLFGTDMIIMGI